MFSRIQRVHFPMIDSTQDEAKRKENELMPGILVAYTADEQTKGRGTHSRSWVSPPNVNIYVTFSFRSRGEKIKIEHIPQMISLTVAQTLTTFGLIVKLKWVNDVLVNDKKIAGILCESDNNDHYHIGIGINVNMQKEICDSLEQPVTSMMLESNQVFDKNEVFNCLIDYFTRNVTLFFKEGLKPFYQSISDMIAYKGEEIVFDKLGENKITDMIKGIVLGINEDGWLRLLVDGKEETFFLGRILRGKELWDGLS